MARRRSLLPLALVAVAACGCGGGSDDAGDHRPALSEQDPRGDVRSASPRRAGVADRPQLDLRAAGIDTGGRRIQIHVTTEAPPRDTVISFTGRQHDNCVDAQLAVEIRVSDRDAPTIAATDRAGALPIVPSNRAGDRPRPVSDARVTVDGTHVVASLPLRRHARYRDWTVFSHDRAFTHRDSLPDHEEVGFARDTGRPNEVGRFCGPARPPLLNR